jgi:hypothetical protein
MHLLLLLLLLLQLLQRSLRAQKLLEALLEFARLLALSARRLC